MKIKLNKQDFLDKLSLSTHFTSTKISSLPVLQGVFIKLVKNKLLIYSSDINSFFHTSLVADTDKEGEFIIEPKKTIEFLSFLSDAKIEIEIKEKQMYIKAEKTKGKFALMNVEDFPLPPAIEEKEHALKTDFLVKNLPLVLFAASSDDTRPALSGINFLTNEELVVVATDGFRLSLIKTKKEKNLPSVIIPADFLREITHYIKGEKEVGFAYSEKEKVVRFAIGETEFFSRLIEGDFPPFDKVIPQEKKTTLKLEKEDFLRNVKLISVFARDYSHIIVLEAKKDGVKFMPKTAEGEENSSFQEGEVDGEDQKVAFNYKFLLDVLNAISSKNVIVEILRSDAPVVFKTENNPDFLHIIMPVRIQE